eukprot:scaffold76261_cov33-Tisochrysis_lutea.AAC.4
MVPASVSACARAPTPGGRSTATSSSCRTRRAASSGCSSTGWWVGKVEGGHLAPRTASRRSQPAARAASSEQLQVVRAVQLL